jgi:hypothetical protein
MILLRYRNRVQRVDSCVRAKSTTTYLIYSVMPSIGQIALHYWLRALSLPRQSQASWHRNRLREELQERRLAETGWPKLSETADVLFSTKRAQHDGFKLRSLQTLAGIHVVPIYTYMLAKYTSRWWFFRAAAFACNVKNYSSVREVVNPTKDHKVLEVACRHRIDPQKFQRACRQLRRVWPLLP